MDDIQKSAINSKVEISNLLKAFSHPSRVEILTYLYDGSKELTNLIDKINLSKTALMKHIDVLLNIRMIKRIERGKYELTQDGKDMYRSIITAYRETKIRFKNVRKQLWKKYLPKSQEKNQKDSEEYLINTPAKYVRGWLSFNSCMTGILNSLGLNLKNYEVAGYDGCAFFINVLKGITCPSGPTFLIPLKNFYEGIKDLGWIVKDYTKQSSRVTEDLPADQEIFEFIYEKVKEYLKQTNRPVIFWGIPIPEYGIINGYKDFKYIVSTYREYSLEYCGEDNPIKYNEIVSPGSFQILYFEKETEKAPQSVADKNTIYRALKMFKNSKYRLGYTSGPEAFNEWATVLEGDIENVSYHGNSYVGICALESISLATSFLEGLYQNYKNMPQENLIKKTIERYHIIKKIMQEFVLLFPFAFDGDLAFNKRNNGAELLRSITPKLNTIVENLKLILDIWE